MAEVIKMPRLSDTMTEGVIAAWHKQVGDTVKKGELLAEIETDKAVQELESYKDGILLHIGIPPGGKLQVDDVLAILGSQGEDISKLVGNGATSAESPKLADDGKPKISEPAPAPPPSANQQPSSKIDISKIEEVVLMPRLSDTMTEGVIAAWNKNVGDDVKKGDVLAEIETDKATMDLESYKDGKLLYQGAKAGEKIQVNELLCIIGPAGFDIAPIVAASKGGGKPDGGVQKAVGSEQSVDKPSANETAPSNQPSAINQPSSAPQIVNEGRILASPLAKKLAEEKGIDLRYVKGTADGGRIIKSDVDSFVPPVVGSTQPAVTSAPAAEVASEKPTTKATTPAATVAPFNPAAGEGFTDTPNSQMRGVIAKRLSESLFTAPHFFVKMEVNMDNAMAARTSMNTISPVKISFNDFVIKATALALKKHPAVNSSWMGSFIRSYSHVHIGMAVAIPDGLIVPVIRFADQKTLSQISAEAKELGGKAKSKKLQPNEFTGNTFTISNLGMMDVDEFTAIINPPDSCILAVGKIKEVVVKKGDGFGVSNFMTLTLSCDHRSVDGAVGAAFLQTLKAYLENPVTMLV